MFKNSYQSGFLSLLYALGSKPLQIWDQEGEASPRVQRRGAQATAAVARPRHRRCSRPWRRPPARPAHGATAAPLSPLFPAREGHVRRVTDEDIQGTALELAADNIANVHISCPADPTKTLGAAGRTGRTASQGAAPGRAGAGAGAWRRPGAARKHLAGAAAADRAPRSALRGAPPLAPPARAESGIKLPHLTLLVKNMKRYFSFEVMRRGEGGGPVRGAAAQQGGLGMGPPLPGQQQPTTPLPSPPPTPKGPPA
jgi:hypothetical protein